MEFVQCKECDVALTYRTSYRQAQVTRRKLILSSILVDLRILPFTDWIPSVADYILVISQERKNAVLWKFVCENLQQRRGRKIKSFVNKPLQTRQYRYAAGSCNNSPLLTFSFETNMILEESCDYVELLLQVTNKTETENPCEQHRAYCHLCSVAAPCPTSWTMLRIGAEVAAWFHKVSILGWKAHLA